MGLAGAFEEPVHVAGGQPVGTAEGNHQVGIVLAYAALAAEHICGRRFNRSGLRLIGHHLIDPVAQLPRLLCRRCSGVRQGSLSHRIVELCEL